MIVDVAGGHGEVLISILKANPGAAVSSAEVGHVVEGARPRIEAPGVAILPGRSVRFLQVRTRRRRRLRHEAHHPRLGRRRASRILRNIGTAMGPRRGHVMLLESVIPRAPNPMGKFIDIEMLALPGGKERTPKEFAELFAAPGSS